MSILSDPQKVQQIANFAGITARQISPLSQGQTSSAWHAEDQGGNAFVVRFIPSGTNRPVTYQSEFNILRLLRMLDQPVPEPIMSSVEIGELPLDISEPWAVTRIVPGTALQSRALSSDTACQLGRFLALLHTLPATGFGRLVEEPVVLSGQQADQLSGIRARWCWGSLWPFDGTTLDDHPLAAIQPEILSKLRSLEDQMHEAALRSPAVLTHTDLYGAHIFEDHGSLTGIIDFGAACVSAPAWDFAVIAFYHGWSAVENVLSGYGEMNGNSGGQLVHDARLLALVVGAYKLSRAVEAHAPETKVWRIVEFVLQTVQEIPDL